jgi:hypothetical protein
MNDRKMGNQFKVPKVSVQFVMCTIHNKKILSHICLPCKILQFSFFSLFYAVILRGPFSKNYLNKASYISSTFDTKRTRILKRAKSKPFALYFEIKISLKPNLSAS